MNERISQFNPAGPFTQPDYSWLTAGAGHVELGGEVGMDSIYGPKTQSIEPSQYPITRGRLLAVGFPHFCRECAWELKRNDLMN